MRSTFGAIVIAAFLTLMRIVCENRSLFSSVSDFPQGSTASPHSPALEKGTAQSIAFETPFYKDPHLELLDEKLAHKQEWKIEKLNIGQALKEISSILKYPILIDEVVGDVTDALDSEIIEQNYDMTFRTLLEVLLNPHELTYAAGKEHLIITTLDEALYNPDYLSLRFYDCRDLRSLTYRFDGFDELDQQQGLVDGNQLDDSLRPLFPKSDRVKLDELLISDLIGEVNTSLWEAMDGEGGTINEVDGMFLIFQPEKAHNKSERLLTLLRPPYVTHFALVGIASR